MNLSKLNERANASQVMTPSVSNLPPGERPGVRAVHPVDSRNRSKFSALITALGMLGLILGTPPAESQDQSPATKVTAPLDPKLQLIGGLASAHVYTTFGYIGVVADNVQKDLYTPDDVDHLMKEITVISDPLIVQLTALEKSDLTPEDAKAVQEIIGIYGLLKKESDALRVYAKEKNAAKGDEFNRLRAETWIRVARLLDIPNQPTSK